MCRDFGVLEGVKLFKFFQAESKNVVIERLGGAAQYSLQCGFISRCFTRIYIDGTTHVPPRPALDPQASIADKKIEPAAVRSAIERLVSLRAASFFKPKEHRTNESHQGAFSRLVWTMKHV